MMSARRRARSLLREARLVIVHQGGAAAIDNAFDVADPDVLARQAEADKQFETRERRGACAAGHELHLVDLLSDHLEPIEDGSTDDDRGAVLIVVEDRNLQARAQLALHVKALGRLDVFKVDAAEGRLERSDHLDQSIGIRFVEFDVEDVDARELLEQHRLALHHGLGGERADVPQAQDGTAVRDDADQIAAGGVAEHRSRIVTDFFAGGGHARRVGEREIALVHQLLRRRDRDFSRRRFLVIVERGTTKVGVFCGGHGAPKVGGSADYAFAAGQKKRRGFRACSLPPCRPLPMRRLIRP